MKELKLVVGVYGSQLEDSRQYQPKVYKTDLDVKVNDFYLAESAHGIILIKIIKVAGKEELDNATFYGRLTDAKWLIKKVNVSDYFELKEKRQILSELEEQMEEMFEKYDKLTLYKLLADYDDNFGKVYDEYRGLI